MRLSGRLRAALGMVILGLGLWYWHGTRPSVTVPSQEDAQAASSLRSLTQQPSTLLTRLDEVSRHATESHPDVVAPFLESLPEDPDHPHRLRNTSTRLNVLSRDHPIEVGFCLNKERVRASWRLQVLRDAQLAFGPGIEQGIVEQDRLIQTAENVETCGGCLLYTSPSPRDS